MIDRPAEPPEDDGHEGWTGTSEKSWQELFRLLAEGQVEALASLYDLASNRLYGLALWHTGSREDARDVVQEVFVKLAEQQDQLRRIRRPRAWLLTVTHRTAVDAVRRRSRRRDEPLEDFPYLEAEVDDPDRAADAQRLTRLVAALPRTQRDVLYLRHFVDCSFAEIGRIVGVPLFTAASRYRLGLARIRAATGGKYAKG